MKTLTIENVALNQIRAYAKNAKNHPESQIQQIAASIQQFGFNNPILVDENLGTQLLLDIRQIFANYPNENINSALLCDKLADIPESPWAEYGYRHERINPRQVAKRLREYNIQSVNLRFGHQVVKGYRIEDFQEAFNRYLPINDRDTATIPENESDHVAAIEAAFATINI